MTTANQKIANKTEARVITLPKHINLEKWEEAGYSWSGTITPLELERLLPLVPKVYQNQPINLTCELAKQGQLLTLLMTFDSDIWVICQRCLQPVAIDLTHQAQLILLQSETQEGLVNDADDYLLLDELLEGQIENSKGERLLPIKKLVEDELLLYIPLSAKHEDCEMAVEQVGEIPEEETPNPFAALQALKGSL